MTDITVNPDTRFIPLLSPEWLALGYLPTSRQGAYNLRDRGELQLVSIGGRTGVLSTEAERYLRAEIKPAGSLRDTAAATKARMANRAGLNKADRQVASPTAGLPLGTPVRKPRNAERSVSL